MYQKVQCMCTSCLGHCGGNRSPIRKWKINTNTMNNTMLHHSSWAATEEYRGISRQLRCANSIGTDKKKTIRYLKKTTTEMHNEMIQKHQQIIQAWQRNTNKSTDLESRSTDRENRLGTDVPAGNTVLVQEYQQTVQTWRAEVLTEKTDWVQKYLQVIQSWYRCINTQYRLGEQKFQQRKKTGYRSTCRQ